MIRLWLDDVRVPPERIEYDLHGVPLNPETGWLWCRTADQAICVIGMGNVSEISLDHDLGALDGVRERTGYDVACFIEEGAWNGTVAPMKWAIHSQNPIGIIRMRAAMESADKGWDRTTNY